jgi:UDP-N-acetylmuramoyl-L-alanyl-D-glutamate--2,6-diaminopimelate ligase
MLRSLVKKIIPKGLFRKIEPYGHLAEAILANIVNGFPARGLKVIGVTGTDGKTTTAFLISHILKSSGLKTAKITTVAVDFADGKGDQPSPSHMTTPTVWRLMKLFKQIRANKPDWVVLETSSHALAQHRVFAVPYQIAVITNLSREHLDYHQTMEAYSAAKQKLFKLTNKTAGLKLGIVNADDQLLNDFIALTKNTVTYGLKSGDLRATKIKLLPDSSQFEAKISDDSYKINAKVTGEFNVYNSLAAIAVGRELGLKRAQIEGGLASFTGVPGRMARLSNASGPTIYIDYAVTPAALESALLAAKKVAGGKVSLVFGATGDRDRGKRPIMGQIAAKHADKIYLTDDETYTEDPAKIRAAVLGGITTTGGSKKTQEFNDRAKAIQAAVSSAKKGDVVLITGLGHQKDRNMGGTMVPWSDAEISQKALS